MPRKARTRRRRPTELGKWHIYQLKTGRSWKGLFGPDFGRHDAFDHDAAAAAWAVVRGSMLAEHIAAHPCTRPWAWWAIEGDRELRRRVDGGAHPCDCGRVPTPSGLPRYVSTGDEFEALYESVPAYLARLGLLTKAERDYLDDHPELLDPVYADDGLGWRN